VGGAYVTLFNKFLGIPGSGKTTALIGKLEDFVLKGSSLESMCFVTFSKSAGRDIKSRVSDKFGIDPKQLFYYGTVHSICSKLLGWDLRGGNPKLALDEDRDDYLSQYGYTYPTTDASVELPETSISDENFTEITDEEKLFALIGWCNNRLVPLEKWRDIGVMFDYMDPSMVLEICKGWSEYKQENDLVDFDDMLLQTVKYNLVPYARALFVDELQDFTPLLYKVFTTWSKDIDEVFVCGDPNQSLYQWAGASSDFLLNLDADLTILNRSYRVPFNILKKAEALISTVEGSHYTDFYADRQGGQFVHLISASFDEIMEYFPSDPEKYVYFLFRTNYLADRFCVDYLIPHGIPYTPVKATRRIHDAWRYYQRSGQKLLDIRDAMVKLQHNEILATWEIKQIINCLPSCSRRRPYAYVKYGVKSWLKDQNEKFEWTVKEILDDLLVKLPKWDDSWILSKMNNLQRDAYIANMQHGYYRLSPDKIRVGTLHSSKGLGAHVVFVFNSHTKAVDDYIMEGGRSVIDDETRLYFVGISRSRESCIFVEDFAEFDNTYVFDMGVQL